MKKTLPFLALLLLVGCAQFKTIQTDISTTYKEDGTKIVREITTRAGSSTFFDSKSQLSNWKASQTDKTQTANVGSLNQEASGTNTVDLIRAIAEGIVSGMSKSLVPVGP